MLRPIPCLATSRAMVRRHIFFVISKLSWLAVCSSSCDFPGFLLVVLFRTVLQLKVVLFRTVLQLKVVLAAFSARQMFICLFALYISIYVAIISLGIHGTAMHSPFSTLSPVVLYRPCIICNKGLVRYYLICGYIYRVGVTGTRLTNMWSPAELHM